MLKNMKVTPIIFEMLSLPLLQLPELLVNDDPVVLDLKPPLDLAALQFNTRAFPPAHAASMLPPPAPTHLQNFAIGVLVRRFGPHV